MAGLEVDADGIRLRLEVTEARVLGSLARGLAGRIERAAASDVTDDVVLGPLLPAGSRGDAAVDAELRGLVRDDLVSLRSGRLLDLADLLGVDEGGAGPDADLDRVLDPQGAMRVVEALNDLRLALAATVGYAGASAEHQDGAPDPGDPEAVRRAETGRLIDALAWLQGGLIEFIEDD